VSFYLKGQAFIFLLVVLSVLCPGQAASIHVPGEAPTIQEAIHMAEPGDTIYIHGGLYRERLSIDRSVNLVGVTTAAGEEIPPVIHIQTGFSVLTNPAAPPVAYAVIAPMGGPAAEIFSDNVRITDLVLFSQESCIEIGNHSGISVEGCLFGDCSVGIAGSGDRLTIIGNRFQTPERSGMDLSFTSDVEIHDNLFYGGTTGIRGENIQRWSVKGNIFQNLTVAVSGNGISDSVIQENSLDNCTLGYTFLSARNNIIQSDHFQNLTQYLYFLNSPSQLVNIGNGNNATTISRDLSSDVTYHTSWLTLTGENFAFSLAPPISYSGYRYFGDRVRITPEGNRTQDTDMVKITAFADVRMWEDIDPFTFGIYRVDHGEPLFTGVTYVSGQGIRTSTVLNASADGTYALLAKKKTPFGLTIEGITYIFLIVAALAALFLYRRRSRARKGPSLSRAQEFRNLNRR
jgi:hypothetical protein